MTTTTNPPAATVAKTVDHTPAPAAKPDKATRAIAAIVCFNNGANAAKVLDRIPPANERDYDVVVVNDGSTDDTATYIAKFDFPVVTHTTNTGVGGAIKSGIRYAIDNGYGIVCILAGNDKDDPRQIPLLLRAVREGGYDYVQGSRFAPGGSHENTPVFRHVMVSVHAKMFQVLTGFRGTDALNGFRAYRTSLFAGGEPSIDVWQDWLDHYELETYLHYKILKTGRPVGEVGVSKTYPPKKSAGRAKYSHIRPIIDWWNILKPLPLLMLRLRK